MHELSIASAIVDNVLELLGTHEGGQVIEVRLQVGELTCVETEQLKFCFEAITKDTTMEKSLLHIERVEAQVACPHCAYRGKPTYWEGVATLQCPACGKAAEATEGHECLIRTIRYAA